MKRKEIDSIFENIGLFNVLIECKRCGSNDCDIDFDDDHDCIKITCLECNETDFINEF